MAYRHDPDLEFLDRATHEDLEPLVYLLTRDPKDGETRWTEELRSKLKNVNDYHYRWQDIAGELQCFGADTFITILRGGKGVLYREVLCDVCDKCDIDYNKNDINIENIENALVAKQFCNFWDRWPNDVRDSFIFSQKILDPHSNIATIGNMASSDTRISGLISSGLAAGGLMSSLIAMMTGALTTSSIAASSISGFSALSLGGTTALSFLGPRAVGFLIPPLAIFSIISVGFAFSGPAYRVTMPACICIAGLRKKVALTPREILRIQKYKKILECVMSELDNYKKSNAKAILMYIFVKKIMNEFGSNDDKFASYISFGETEAYELAKDEITKKIVENDIYSSLKLVIDAGYGKEHLVNIIELIAANADKSESEDLPKLLKKLYLA